MIYKKLLEGNERFGTKPRDLCYNLLSCEPELIHKYVVVAPFWKPKAYSNLGASIDIILDGYQIQIYNIHIDKIDFTYINTGLGAPIVGDTTLTLGCTPCEKAIFLGSVGALHSKFGLGDIVIPEYSVCGDGFCRYITESKLKNSSTFGDKYYPNSDFNRKIGEVTNLICESNNVNWHKSKNFCVDSIFAEYAHIDEIIEMGCDTIEMETAAFFKSAEIAGIKSGAIFNVTDNSINNKTLFTGRLDEEREYIHKVRKEIIPQIILDLLK